MYYLLTAAIYILDQLSKFYIRNDMFRGESRPVIDGVFHITFVHNTGAAFGILKGMPYIFVIVSVLSIIIINYFLLSGRYGLARSKKIALSFILAGTLGNLTDRILFGYVIDFFDFRVWPVFNIADSFISVGAFILGISLFFDERKKSTDTGEVDA